MQNESDRKGCVTNPFSVKNCKNVNVCKGEVEAKSANKDYAPESGVRRIVCAAEAGTCCCHSH